MVPQCCDSCCKLHLDRCSRKAWSRHGSRTTPRRWRRVEFLFRPTMLQLRILGVFSHTIKSRSCFPLPTNCFHVFACIEWLDLSNLLKNWSLLNVTVGRNMNATRMSSLLSTINYLWLPIAIHFDWGRWISSPLVNSPVMYKIRTDISNWVLRLQRVSHHHHVVHWRTRTT